jgi:type I restriction enzyme, S subunit
MNALRLLRHYEQMADAPEAIARLRRFVLDLAVRGKLVPQDPKDEPAAELLRQIADRRAAMVANGDAKPAKRILATNENKRLFAIPERWVWTNANEMWDFENGDRSKNYPSKDQLVSSGIPFVNAGHLVGGRVDLSEMNYISREKFQQRRQTTLWRSAILPARLSRQTRTFPSSSRCGDSFVARYSTSNCS